MSAGLYLQSFKNVATTSPSEDLLRRYNSLNIRIKSREFPMIDIAIEEDDFVKFERLAQKALNYKKTLVLGVGGSSLGGKTLTSLKFQNRVCFLESIDPVTIKNTLDEIDLKNTFFLVISKSGETIETICQALILLDKMQEAHLTDFSKQFLFITESYENSLAKIAAKLRAEVFLHPKNIGGRFSCFSVVGMLPALIAGTDIKKIRHGAKEVLSAFLSGPQNNVVKACAVQIELYRQGFTNNVVMPYIDSLKNFTDWYRQLWAESLGKNQFGSTPINSMGTIDQHSQLQLYLDGPKNKFFTFFTQNQHQNDYRIKDLDGCETLFGNKKLSDIINVEQTTTIATLNQKKLPIRLFTLESLNEEVLGALMMQMFLETILMAEYKRLNAFDQPAVEYRKSMAKKMLQNL